MYNIYITGDRSMAPMTAAFTVDRIIKSLLESAAIKGVEDVHFITCNAPGGVEAAVRYLVPNDFLTVVKRNIGVDGHLDFDATNELIQMSAQQVIVLHPDPMASRVTQSVARIFDPSIVMYPISSAMAQNATPENI